MNYNDRGKNKDRKSLRRDRNREEQEKQSEETNSFITEQDLIGTIYSIKEAFWNFKFSGRENHPGACLDVIEMIAYLVHGTDSNSRIANFHRKNSYVIEPTDQNGLTKSTSFILELYTMRVRKLLLYHIDCKIGCLNKEDLELMKERIARIYPEPWEVNS